MLIIFLFGYLLIAFDIVRAKIEVGILFIGIILFLGAVFVYIGIQIQYEMLDIANKAYNQVVNSLVRAIECRDEYTSGHSEHVANLCVLICKYMSKKCKRSNDLHFAGILHDVGKIGIREEILNKEGRLTTTEYEEIKKHAEYGFDIIEHVDGLKNMAEWILYHHERVDGDGYYKISNEMIPQEAKVIALADTFSALITDRPYRKGMNYFDAIEILKKCAGSQLDKTLVEDFIQIPQQEVEACIPDKIV